MLDAVDEQLTEDYVEKLHSVLKAGTSSEYNEYAPVGRYKVFENEVGQIATAAVDQVEETMYSLLLGYNFKKEKDLAYLASFHACFEQIHPFADGNGRVARLLLYKECLKEGITPFIVDDTRKADYYNALEQFQVYDNYKLLIDYFVSEQKSYANYLKNKGFEGKINDSKDRDTIKKKSKIIEESPKKAKNKGLPL
ncbi:Fic family protein [Streptococcus macedonicus]|nr:Fic family protein [uncultured Streptococcus sp.]MCW8518431.1 Fic family protein [Streptococcus macedonicus]MCW8520287.1 Fic family protein [Streptococcus macedonicus]